MKEYCIYCIWNGGKPFIQGTYKTLDSAKVTLFDMISLEEERQSEMDVLQEAMTKEDISSTEKNNLYEKLKYLNEIQGQEELLEKKLKSNLKLDCFVKIDNNEVKVVAIKETHDSVLANQIMKMVQQEFSNKVYVTIQFEK